MRAATAIAAIALAAIAAAATAPAPIAPLRGVHPDAAPLYGGPRFACDGGRVRLAASAVNDDYCDCADGTDEPGEMVEKRMEVKGCSDRDGGSENTKT